MAEPLARLLWKRYRKYKTIPHRNRLVEYYRSKVDTFVRGYFYVHDLKKNSVWDEDDAKSDIIMDLIDAIKTFSPRRHVPFEAYLRLRMEWSIKNGLRGHDYLSREHRREEGHPELVSLHRPVGGGNEELGQMIADSMIEYEVKVSDHKELIRHACRGLPRYAHIVVSCYGKGLFTQRETADIIGVSTGCVRVWWNMWLPFLKSRAKRDNLYSLYLAS